MILIVVLLIALYFFTKESGSLPVADTKTAQNISATFFEMADRTGGIFGIPPSVILAIIAVESSGDVNAKGSSGEVGLMQVTEIALKQVNKVNNWSFSMNDLLVPDINIQVGTAYLHWTWQQTGSLELGIKAYNHRLADVLANHSEGQEYFNKVASYEVEFRKIISGF